MTSSLRLDFSIYLLHSTTNEKKVNCLFKPAATGCAGFHAVAGEVQIRIPTQSFGIKLEVESHCDLPIGIFETRRSLSRKYPSPSPEMFRFGFRRSLIGRKRSATVFAVVISIQTLCVYSMTGLDEYHTFLSGGLQASAVRLRLFFRSNPRQSGLSASIVDASV